ncbi:MAG: twin-arginine translocase TatA/TatE family subunit [Solirubrobacteraceae bacterium]
MLGLDNPIHILFVLIVLLLVFGAKRLPEMGKSMGEGLRGFKDSISGESSVNPMTADDHAPQRVEELTPAAPVAPAVTVGPTPEREPVAEPTRVGTAA